MVALVGIGGYLSTQRKPKYKRKGDPKPDDVLPNPYKGNEKKETPSNNKQPPITGKLQIIVDLSASGSEKFAIGLGAFGGESGLKNKVNQTAQKLIPKLNQGPIPKIITKAYPKSFKSIDGGYRYIVSYGAEFHAGAKNEPVRKVALKYITKVLKSDKEFGPRIKAVKAAKVG